MSKAISLLSLFFLCLSISVKAQPHYHYLTYLPEKYKSNRHKKWPLIIYLHGSSACGRDLDKVRSYGLPFFTDRGMQLDAVAVSPQCPKGKNWTTDNWLDPFLKDVTEKYHIDTTRIYLTGMSLGGFGTWDLAIKYPHRFAAVVPLCGGGKPQFVCAIKDVPVWVLHGDHDEQVPIRRSEEMVDALRKCGGNPKFTVLKGFPHDIHRMYGDESIYKWMLQYSLNEKRNFHEEVAVNDTMTGIPAFGLAETHPQVQQKVEIKEEIPDKKTIQPEQTKQPKHKPSKPARHKPVKEDQTDTIRGKDFILVF